jgi:hypothetical protein
MKEEFFGVWNLGGQLMNCIQSILGLKQTKTEESSANSPRKPEVPDNSEEEELGTRGPIQPASKPVPPRRPGSRSIEQEPEQTRGPIQPASEPVPPPPPSRSIEAATNENDMVSFEFRDGRIEIGSILKPRGPIQPASRRVPPRRPPRR